MKAQEIKAKIQQARDMIAEALSEYQISEKEGLTEEKLNELQLTLEKLDSITYDM